MLATVLKTSFITAFSLLICLSVFAQAPESMSYQAVIRNSAGDLVANLQIGIRISIIQSSASGTQVYQESHTPTTNANGLVSLSIGNGSSKVGTFSDIDWGNGPYFIQTETNPSGTDATYTITGTTQLMSVPYALYAKTSGSNFVPEYAYIYNTSSQIVAPFDGVMFSDNGVMSGSITHIPGSSEITLGKSGTYEIAFIVSGTEPNQFSLYKNGTLIGATTYGSGAGTQQNSGMAIITVTAGDVLSLVNYFSAIGVSLETFVGGAVPVVNAAIKIHLLSN